MTIQVVPEADVIEEARKILLQHMTPSKAARFWASWQHGHHNYLAWRDETFQQETVDSLYHKIVAFQGNDGKSSAPAD